MQLHERKMLIAGEQRIGDRPTQTISVIIGSDNYWRIVTGRIERLSSDLCAVEKIFGWLVQGIYQEDTANDLNRGNCSTSALFLSCERHNQATWCMADPTEMWRLDAIGITDPPEAAGAWDQESLSLFRHTMNAKQELEGEAGRLHIGSGQVILPVSFREKVPKLIFKTEESSPEVSITAVDLKCNGKQGRGFMISVHRSKQIFLILVRRALMFCVTFLIFFSIDSELEPTSSTDYLKHQGTDDYDTERIAPLVCDIRDPCSKITNLTGGKGASLAVLQSIAVEIKTFSVPRGFIVTTESYKRLASSEEFQALIKKVENAEILGNRVNCQEALKDACISVVGGIENLEMPDDVSEEILQRLSNFDADTRFAVRSSELGEDSEDMSAAGQLRTLLGLRGQDNVIKGVLKCWASQFSFTNVSYKRQHGQPLNVPMAVVVQELVDASAAGVMFTCDPVTGSPSKITVAANYGIGESVVSASAEPDTFVLKRTGMRRPVVESMNIGRKAVYTTLSASGGVVTLSLDEGKDSAACISNDDVERLAFIGVQIEKCYTTPRDIEWATRNGCIFMLQCRPVTTLFRESDCEMIHEFDNGLKSEKEVLCKGNMSEVLPGATSPLGLHLHASCF
ncbi:hypothetical protein MTO96_040534 [Rhipicephalus appendiculatus]